jgi:AraC-like DNA-binding protein
MRKKRPSRIELDSKSFDFPFVKAIGYDHILNPIPLRTHKHQGYELTFILSGEVCWMLTDCKETLQLTGNAMAVIQPETQHKGKWDIISPAAFFWILLDPSSTNTTRNSILKEHDITKINTTLAKAGNKSCKMSGEIEVLLEMLLTEMQQLTKKNKNQLAAASIRSLLSIIILKSVERFSEQQQDMLGVYKTGLSQAIAFMNKNIARDISVTEIANNSGISVTRFSENFKKEMGISPAQYFSRLKCDKAREILLSTSYSITRICFSLGFSSTQYFANVFKKYTGMSPRKYRAEHMR